MWGREVDEPGAEAPEPDALAAEERAELERVLDEEDAARPRRRPLRRLVAGSLVVLLVAATGAGGWFALRSEDDATPIPVLLQAGLAAQQQGESLTARGIYLEVVARSPDNATALFNLGVLAQAAGDSDEALARYRAANEADPTLTGPLFNLATILARTDRAEAVNAYRRVLELDPSSAAAHLNLGLVLAELGSLADARAELAAAIGLDPSLRTRVPAVHTGLLPKR